MSQLNELTAMELSTAYRAGQTTPTEVLNDCMKQHDRVNPVLNAVVALDRDGAEDAARASSRRWAEGSPLSPLDGVPLTIKDNLKQSGLPATWGSRAFSSYVPERDELAVARLRAAGAVLIGKTNTPELALAGHTSNDVYGTTVNPWDVALTPGGSSGGAVAALMGGIAPLALATDAGGSVRRPAGHAGAVGLRTTPGLVPRRHGFPALANDLQTIGPIARSVADLRAMLECLADTVLPAAGATLSGAKIGVIGQMGKHPVDAEILERLEATASILSGTGAVLIPIDAPWDPDEMTALFMGLASAGVCAALGDEIKNGFAPSAAIARLAEAGAKMPAAEYCGTMATILEWRWRAVDLFETFDFLLTPSSAAPTWTSKEPYPRTIAGQLAGPRASAIYTTFANVAGLPALAFPTYPSSSGLPIGMQLIGPSGSDWRLLDAGCLIERMIGWPRVAPGYGSLD